MRKDSLVRGTLILAMAALIARVLGVLQKVPLKHLLGDGGMASFMIAFNIYSLLLIIATAGIPSALSKLISERSESGRMDEAFRIYRAAMGFAIVMGTLLTAGLIFAAPYYATYIADDPESALAIRALAPALLLFPMIAMMRGYFQGLQFMMAGGMSQIVEQILRVATAVLLAYVFLEFGYSQTTAIAGASFGGVMGGVGALAVMMYYFARYKKTEVGQALTAGSTHTAHHGQKQTLSIWHAYKLIFVYSIPITFSALAVPLINFIDSSTVISLLKGDLGYTAAKEALGILGARAQSLAGIPIILAIAVSQTALPVISSAHARGDMDEVRRRSSQAMWLAAIFGLWIVIIIIAAARPLNGFIFGDTKGTSTIVLLTGAAMLQIVMMTSASILNGLGKMKSAAAHVYVGIAIKLAATYALSPWIGMAGVIASTALSFVAIVWLNFRLIRKHVTLQVLQGRWIALILTAASSLTVGYALDWIGQRWIIGFINPINYFLQTVLVSGATGGLFLALLFVFGVIRNHELAFLPARLRTIAQKFTRSK
jgi:stage V sporulation protein B